MFRRPKNTTERLALRPAYIPKDARCVLEHSNGSAAYAYETAGRCYALTFWGTAAKPTDHHSYRTEAQRDAAIWAFRTSVEQSLQLRAEQTAKRKPTPNAYTVGDIVHTSWGYDQTNVDFYVVTRVSAGCVWVRKVAADYEQTGFMSGRTWPAMPIQPVGDESRHVVRGGHFSIEGHGASIATGDCYSSSYA